MKKQEVLNLIEIFGLHVICDSWNDDNYLKIHWDKSTDCTSTINTLIISKSFDDNKEEVCQNLRNYLIRKGYYQFKLITMKTIKNMSPELTYLDEKEIFMI